MLHGATPNRLKQMLDSGNRVRDYLIYRTEENGTYMYVIVSPNTRLHLPGIGRYLNSIRVVT